MSFYRNIRFYVLVAAAIFAASIFLLVWLTVPAGSIRIIKLTQLYALSALAALYITLLIGPAVYSFAWLPYKGEIYRARRAIGDSAFFFALIHASFAFFGQLGGFAGLFYLDNKYLLAISLSFIALLILAAMAATSFDIMVAKLGAKWKILHRFIYLAAVLILIHALILGTHFQDLSGAIPQLFLGAFFVLLVLEANRFDAFLARKFAVLPRFGISLVLVAGVFTAYSVISFLPQGSTPISLGIHAAHIQLAKQAQSGSVSNLPANRANISGLQGDRTKRYTASFLHPDVVKPKEDTTLKFRVNDASSGTTISFFQRVYAYPMHLMIVDSTLSSFSHIHPDQQGNEFTITTQFPKVGFYHLYIQFQPLGGIEQQFAFTLPVGVSENDNPAPATQPVDTNMTKLFGDFEVTLSTNGVLKVDDMTLGKDKLTFTIKDAKAKTPITTLKPFMAAFGHLTMINEQTYDFIHVHPNNLVAPAPDANGGPTVDFLPIGIYGPFKPGIYRAFGEFSAKIGEDFDTDFTVKVE